MKIFFTIFLIILIMFYIFSEYVLKERNKILNKIKKKHDRAKQV